MITCKVVEVVFPEAGFPTTVAPLGTALTEQQMELLWKVCPEPILCFDGDNAGRRAATRACERILPLLKPNQSAVFAFLPEGQDPDSLIRTQGKDVFKKIIQGAIPLVDFIWANHTAGRQFETPESKAGLAKILEGEADRIGDRTVQQYYKQAFRDKLYKTFGRQNFRPKNQRFKDNRSGSNAALTLSKPIFSAKTLPYQVLLATLINHPVIFDDVEEYLGQVRIPNERLDLLRQIILNKLSGDPALDSAALQNHLKDQGFETELRAVLSESVYTHAGFSRPGTEEDQILEGWLGTQEFLQRRDTLKEYKQAGKILAENLSKDNEDKMLALYRMQNVNKAGNE